jgi:hypothetical protein
MAFPCIDVGRSEETKAEIDRHVVGGEFTAAKSGLVARKEDENQDKGGAGTGTDELENARRILKLMPNADIFP